MNTETLLLLVQQNTTFSDLEVPENIPFQDGYLYPSFTCTVPEGQLHVAMKVKWESDSGRIVSMDCEFLDCYIVATGGIDTDDDDVNVDPDVQAQVESALSFDRGVSEDDTRDREMDFG